MDDTVEFMGRRSKNDPKPPPGFLPVVPRVSYLLTSGPTEVTPYAWDTDKGCKRDSRSGPVPVASGPLSSSPYTPF